MSKLTIVGREARDISQHVKAYVLRRGTGWQEVQGMNECRHGCKLYARKRGCVVEYRLIHSASYGCQLGKHDATRDVPVSVRPAVAA